MSQKFALLKSNNSSSHSSVYLYVSFYLVLLAFFILLNSIASIEEQKKLQGIDSLHTTFSTGESLKYIPPIKISNKEGGIGPHLAVNNSFDDIKKLTKESLTLLDAQIIEYENNLQINIPIKTFFNEDSPYIRSEHSKFLDDIVAELDEKDTISLEIILPHIQTETYPDVKNNISLQRANVMVTALHERNIDKTQFFVGIITDETIQNVTFLFLENIE